MEQQLIINAIICIFWGMLNAGASWAWIKFQDHGHIFFMMKQKIKNHTHVAKEVAPGMYHLLARNLWADAIFKIFCECQFCNVVWLNIFFCLFFYNIIFIVPITGASYITLLCLGKTSR